MTSAPPWFVEITDPARRDISEILRWTDATFGEQQARVYSATITLAIRDLSDGPEAPGTRSREAVQAGLRSLHIARKGRRGRHALLFRIGSYKQKNAIIVLRVLHDSMDIVRHLPRE